MADDIRTINATNGFTRTGLGAFLQQTTVETKDDASTDDKASETEEHSSDTANVGDEGEAADSSDEGSGEESTGDESDSRTPDTVYKVKDKDVSVKDLINSYETREEISRRFDDVGKREKRIESEWNRIRKEKEQLDFINEKFEEMHEQVLAGNPLAALQIAMSMGTPKDGEPPKGMQDLIKQAIQIADNFHQMSDEEQRIFLQKEELAHKERAIDRKAKKQSAAEKQIELRAYYDKVLAVNKLTDAELDGAYEDIMNQEKFKAELEAKKDEKERISYCASWVLGKRLNAVITEGITKVEPKLVNDNNFRIAMLDIVDAKCTVDDVAVIVRNYIKASNDSASGESAASKQSPEPKKTGTSHRAPTEKPKAGETNKPIFSYNDILAKYSH